jgi:hypothetical protein
MDSAVASMSSTVSPLSARQTRGRRIGRNRGTRVEEEAKAICFQQRRDITGVQAEMQLNDSENHAGNTFGQRG